MNLAALPDRRAAENPLGSAIADDKTDLDNAQFLAAVQRAAASLRARGISAGDVVAVMLPNTATFVVSLFAAWRLGAAVTPINPFPHPGRSDLSGRRRRSQGGDRPDRHDFDPGAPVVSTDALERRADASGS